MCFGLSVVNSSSQWAHERALWRLRKSREDKENIPFPVSRTLRRDSFSRRVSGLLWDHLAMLAAIRNLFLARYSRMASMLTR
jgi:hypothetical protein